MSSLTPCLSPFLPSEPEPVQAQQSKTGKYVPPSLRDGASRRGESMQPNRRGKAGLSSAWGQPPRSPARDTGLSQCRLRHTANSGRSPTSGPDFPCPFPPADDNATIRVTNLSEDTRETDLQELFRPFGSISRIYLAKDKTTGQSKVGVEGFSPLRGAEEETPPASSHLLPFLPPQGFAFISFHRREDAARAIAGVSGFGYDHLILNVEWAK